jgi:hypothetical protein
MNTPIMTVINNQTGLPHFWFKKSGAADQILDVLVIRGTFDFAQNGKAMTLAKTQAPICFADELSNSSLDGTPQTNPLHAVVLEDGDLLPYKPGTDVLVQGHAQAPDAKPHADWAAGISIGTAQNGLQSGLQKTLHLHGPRLWQKGILGWKLGKTTPVSRVPLDYRLAYGGCIDLPAQLSAEGEADAIHYPANPAGMGWLPSSTALNALSKPARQYVNDWIHAQSTLAAPQILAVNSALRSPQDHLEPQGLSPTARWWTPRVNLQGSYDEAWHAKRAPLLPNDFDASYYQYATPDMVAKPHLAGNETAVLVGLLGADTKMRLPGWRIIAAVKQANGEHSVSYPLLDTVRFDLDRQQASLVWRIHFDASRPMAEISLGVTMHEIKTTAAQQTSQGARA